MSRSLNMDRNRLLNRVCLKCADFVRQLSLHRAFDGFQGKLRQNFWIYIYNNSIDMAVLDWCHLFGSHSDDLHWKKIVPNIIEFREDLYKHLETNETTWIVYRDNLKGYRDKNVAHIEIRPLTNIPDMTFALDSVSFYYGSVIKVLKNENFYSKYPNDLSRYYADCLKQTKIYVSAAFDATKVFKEEVF